MSCVYQSCARRPARPAEPNVIGAEPTEALKYKILVVDDNADSAEAIAKLLQLKGYDVRRAFDGASAVTIAQQFEPHLVLLDIRLPDIDGYEVLRRLRDAIRPVSTTSGRRYRLRTARRSPSYSGCRVRSSLGQAVWSRRFDGAYPIAGTKIAASVFSNLRSSAEIKGFANGRKQRTQFFMLHAVELVRTKTDQSDVHSKR